MTCHFYGSSARLAALPLLLLASGAAAQQEPDRAGSSDHRLTGRYQGSHIIEYEKKEYEEVRFLKPPLDAAGTGSAPLTDAFSVPLSGRSTTMVYEGPKGRSVLEVLNNYLDRLNKSGFATVAKCRGEECGLIGSNTWIQQLYFRGLRTARIAGRPVRGDSNSSTVYALLQRKSPAGDVWVSLYGSEFGPAGAVKPNIAVSVLDAKPMETGNMVFVDAAAMREAMDATGRVALYGIYFDTGKAELRPESSRQLAEIAALLKGRPALKVLVVGHTDNQGGFDYNMDLSRLRAAAVTGALNSRHAVPAARLKPVGVGMASPVDTNRTEEGRAKNRRVEIVEY